MLSDDELSQLADAIYEGEKHGYKSAQVDVPILRALYDDNAALRTRLAEVEHENTMLNLELKMKGEAWIAGSAALLYDIETRDKQLAEAAPIIAAVADYIVGHDESKHPSVPRQALYQPKALPLDGPAQLVKSARAYQAKYGAIDAPVRLSDKPCRCRVCGEAMLIKETGEHYKATGHNGGYPYTDDATDTERR